MTLNNSSMIEAKLPVLLFYGLIHLAAVAVSGDSSSSSDGKFIYSSFAGANLTLDGDAVVTPSGLLQLTDVAAVSKGHAFHPAPLLLRRSPTGGDAAAAAVRSFSASFVFGIVPVTPGYGGHGLALVVAASKDLSSGTASSYLGLLNRTSNGAAGNRLVAVELDTIESPEFQDRDDNHVGVDVNSLVSVNASAAGYYAADGEFRSLALVSGEPMQAWVDYDGGAKRIDVALAPAGTKKPTTPLVSAGVDLPAVIAADVAYLGFSASTGRLTTRHYVLGYSFAVDAPAPAIDTAKLPKLPPSPRSSKSKSKILAIALPIAASVLALAMAAGLLLLVRRRYTYVELREDWEIEFGAHRLSYKDLLHATDRFSDKNLLGAGGFGTVYKGVLPASGTGTGTGTGTEVAVKTVAHGSRQGMKEFVAEVATVGRLRHRNLVQLLGYCRLNGELLLVYDYMPNGSVEQHLYGGGGDDGSISKPTTTTTTLSWAQRFRIIRGVASGLLYLHEEWEQVVVHRDVKSSNVLLDGDMNARLGDFGLARLHGRDAAEAGPPRTTAVAGTFGYMAPELALTGRASPLTDVFAFGAFLLEVVTGRRPVEEAMDGSRVMLVDWVFEHWRREALVEAVDPRMQGDYDVDELGLSLRVGLLCSHPLAGVRPWMRQVVQYLAGDAPVPEVTPPTHTGMSMLALLQNRGLDSFVMGGSASSMTSLGTTLSGGR